MKKIISLLLIAVLCTGCAATGTAVEDHSQSIKPFEVIMLTDIATDSVDFSGLTWGMSEKDALKALNLDKSMVIPAVLADDVVSRDDIYAVNEPTTAGVPDILKVTFSRETEMLERGSLISMSIGYTDKAELEAAIAHANAIYGEVRMKELQDENGNPNGNFIGNWNDKQNPIIPLGDRAQEFCDAFIDEVRKKSDTPDAIKNMPSEALQQSHTTTATVVMYDKPDENGLVGFIEMNGIFAAQVNQFLSK